MKKVVVPKKAPQRRWWLHLIQIALALVTVLAVGVLASPKAHASGGFSIHNWAAGKCLDLSNGNPYDGAYIQLYQCNGTASQQWSFDTNTCTIDNGTRYCLLRSGVNSGYCLDADGNNINNGGKVQLWQCNGGDNQKWAPFSSSQGGVAFYLWAGSNLVLDANSSCTGSDGCNIQIWTYWGGSNQRWYEAP